ncbi:hypothetical protein [Sphingobacterium thalpophilum]|uniref:hypothetical protein n=1 Tax=Sphingobacterium thalpophilum TaxID=259 RepID=UPI0024A62538|nr:hypothetical protein [Sphingobacterium thalpophilum]
MSDNILEPTINGLPPVTDWQKVFLALQQANEAFLRGATLPELGKQIIGDVQIQGADFVDLPVAEDSTPVALPIPETGNKFGFLANGKFSQPTGGTLEYSSTQWGLTLFDGEKWVKKFTLKMPEQKLDIVGGALSYDRGVLLNSKIIPLSYSENKFDSKGIIKGYLDENSNWVDSPDYHMSDFLPVKANSFYTLCKITDSVGSWYDDGNFAFFNDKRELIEYWKTDSSDNLKRPRVIFRMPENTAYFGFVISTPGGDLIKAKQLMLLSGRRIPGEYITYKEAVNNVDLLEYSDNKFDKSRVTYGGYWALNGISWVVDLSFVSSDFIPIEPGRTICINGDTGKYDIGFAYTYDKDFNVVNLYTTATSFIDKKFTPTTNEYYLVLVVPKSVIDTLMVIEGNSYPNTYISSRRVIKNDLLPKYNASVPQESYAIGALDFQIPTTDILDISIYGQSLSTGQQAYPSLTTENFRGNKMIGDQVWLNYGNNGQNVLTDLVSKRANSTISYPKSRGGQSQDESPVIAFANATKLMCDRLMMTNNNTIVANSTGTDGKTIEQLLTAQYYDIFKDKLTKLKSIADSQTKSISCPIILYLQGEYNYTQESGGTKDKNAYKALCKELKNKMQDDIHDIYNQESKPIFMTYQCGTSFTRGNDVSIGMAQLEFALENEDSVIVCPTYNFSYRGGHLDANGYRWMGEQLAKAYNKVLRGEKFLPLYPTGVKKANNNQVRVTFHVPVGELAFDRHTVQAIPNDGFYVYNGTGELPISTLEIQGNSVLITLGAAITEGTKVSYAGEIRGGRGNLRDSDKTLSMYTYLDLDRKLPNGEYVYPRDNNETLRPNFEPKDASGSIIYDQRYPLFNFCMAFCLDI